MKITTRTSAEPINVAMLTTSDDDVALASRPMTLPKMEVQGACVSLPDHGEINPDHARIQSLWTVFAKFGLIASVIVGKPAAPVPQP